jgi:hypothetical protein
MAMALFRDSPLYEKTIAAIGSVRRRSASNESRPRGKPQAGTRPAKLQPAASRRRSSRRARS